MKMRDAFTCPLELVHDMIQGKWKPIILWRLRLQPLHCPDWKRTLTESHKKCCWNTSKELIDYGFVEKKTFDGYPLRVEYSLTEEQGRELLEALKIMQQIGIKYLKSHGKEDVLIEKGILPG